MMYIITHEIKNLFGHRTLSIGQYRIQKYFRIFNQEVDLIDISHTYL